MGKLEAVRSKCRAADKNEGRITSETGGFQINRVIGIIVHWSVRQSKGAQSAGSNDTLHSHPGQD
jgi:hypothetical protein